MKAQTDTFNNNCESEKVVEHTHIVLLHTYVYTYTTSNDETVIGYTQ